MAPKTRLFNTLLSKYSSAIVTTIIAIFTLTLALGVAKSQISNISEEVHTLKAKQAALQQKVQTIEVLDAGDRELLKYISKNVDEIKVDVKELQKDDRSPKK